MKPALRGPNIKFTLEMSPKTRKNRLSWCHLDLWLVPFRYTSHKPWQTNSLLNDFAIRQNRTPQTKWQLGSYQLQDVLIQTVIARRLGGPTSRSTANSISAKNWMHRKSHNRNKCLYATNFCAAERLIQIIFAIKKQLSEA
jgi:hypothetical protein